MLGSSNASITAAVEALPVYTQEDVLALLIWREEAVEAVGILTPDHFSVARDLDYRALARQALNFWKEFRAPPRDHYADLVLQTASEAQRERMLPVLRGLQELAPRLNISYLHTQLDRYMLHAQVRSKIVRATEILAAGRPLEADQILARTAWRPVQTAPLTLDATRALGQFLADTTFRYPSGIKALDAFRIGPGRKELYLVIAPPKRGKSWWLIHIGKWALLARARVLHITLEMRQEQVLLRYLQSFTGRSRRDMPPAQLPQLLRDEQGNVCGLSHVSRPAREGMLTPSGETLTPAVIDTAARLGSRYQLLIKEFAPRSVTPQDLEGFLDDLQRTHSFTPDVIIVDYGDLLKVDTDNYRIALGDAFVGLRRLAVERNAAVVTASQSSRDSSKSVLVTDADVAEDYSKIATADWSLTYSQTAAERHLGMARVFVAAGRDEQDKQLAVISQSYALGQFCIDSALMPASWQEMLNTAGNPP